MILLRLGWLITLVVALTSCGTSYQPVGEYGGIPHGGYKSTRINANTFIVSFTGNSSTPKRTVDSYMLYRCARVTMENGYDYFVITSTSASSTNLNLLTKNEFINVPDPAKLYMNQHVKTTYQSYTTSQTATTCFSGCNNYAVSSFAVIQMFTGPVPAGLPRAFSVTDVIAHLGPTVS